MKAALNQDPFVWIQNIWWGVTKL